jgi:hypothetical protein
MIAGAALILLAVACLAGSALAWTGRWRAWARRFPTFVVITPLGFLAAFGVMLLAAGLILVGAGEPSSPGVAIVFVLAFPLLILDFIAPKWFAPSWLREERRGQGVQADVTDPLTALAYAAVAATEDDRPHSAAAVQRRFRGADPRARWKAAWVFGEEQGTGPHGLARAGVSEGRLWLYDDGLAFSAGTIEDMLADGEQTAVIAREDVTGVRTVPARAGADGRRAPGPAARSVFKRLVVETTDGPYLFEVMRAESKARRIEQTLRER